MPVSLPANHSFFKDCLLTGSLEIECVQTTAAVQKGTVPVAVVIAAPFKRLLWQLALTLSSILAAIVVVRMYATLRKTD